MPFSKAFVFGPVVIHPDFNTSTTASISVCVISGGEKGIFLINKSSLNDKLSKYLYRSDYTTIISKCKVKV